MTAQFAPIAVLAPEALAQALFVRVSDPEGKVSLLLGNVHQHQAQERTDSGTRVDPTGGRALGPGVSTCDHRGRLECVPKGPDWVLIRFDHGGGGCPPRSMGSGDGAGVCVLLKH